VPASDIAVSEPTDGCGSAIETSLALAIATSAELIDFVVWIVILLA
jgi:hypothetical protein